MRRGFVTVVLCLAIAIPLVGFSRSSVGGTVGWGSPTLIETENLGEVRYARVAVDRNGNAVAVWWQWDGARYNIWANRFVPGSGWGTATLIETSSATEPAFPQVAVDPSGNAIVVWHESSFSGFDIWANRFTPEGGWGTATLIETDPGSAQFPQVAMDANGNAIAVWHGGSTGVDIWANRFVKGVGWGTPQLVETGGGSATYPQVAVDPNGNAIAVWGQSDGIRYNIWANRFTPESGWGTATLIETDNAGDAQIAQVAMDANGDAIAVWTQSIGTTHIFANRFVPGSGWGSPAVVEFEPPAAECPQIAMDSNGNGLAVWMQSDSTGLSIWANRFQPSLGWDVPVVVEALGDNIYTCPQLAVHPSGKAMAVWSHWIGGRPSILSNWFLPGDGWGTPTLVEGDNTGNALYPHVALDPNGNAIAVWSQSDGVRDNAWANRYVADDLPPSLVLTSPQETLTNASSATVSGTTDPYASVTVNSLIVTVDPTGAFSTPLALSEGPNTIVVVATDTDGNAATATRSIVRDSTPPMLSVSSPVDGAVIATSIVPVFGTAADSGSGLARLSVNGILLVPASPWSVNLPLTDGVRTIKATAQDLAGNVAEVPVSVTVDTGTVTLLLTSPTSDLTNQATVTVAGLTQPGASVTVNGFTVPVAPDGSFSTAVSLVEGPNTIVVIATDSGGSSKRIDKTITRDSAPPVLTVTSPGDGAWLRTNVVRVAGSVIDAGSGVAQLSVNGVVIVPVASWNVDLALPDGTDTIAAMAVDKAGNTASISVSVTIDTVAPPLSLSSPVERLTNQATVTVRGSTEVGVTLTVNGVPMSVDPGGSFSTTVTLVEGPNSIDVVATDYAGNAATASLSIARDSTPPGLAITSPANGATTESPTITVSGTTEPGVGLDVNGIAVAVASNGRFSAQIALADGANVIIVTATDLAGNAATTSVTVTYANPVPGLNQALHDTQQALNETRDALTATEGELSQTNQELQDTRDSLQEANANLSALGLQLIVGLIIVVAVSAAGQAAVYKKLRPR